MDHGDCPVMSSKPSDPQQRRPDGRMYLVETAEQSGSVNRLADLTLILTHNPQTTTVNTGTA